MRPNRGLTSKVRKIGECFFFNQNWPKLVINWQILRKQIMIAQNSKFSSKFLQKWKILQNLQSDFTKYFEFSKIPRNVILINFWNFHIQF